MFFEMARGSPSSEIADEEDYIDMEVSSSTFFCYSSVNPSPHPTREFEFQMSSKSLDRETTTSSPADELFYKGKLLPLHLPPRLEMVEKLLQTSSNTSANFEMKSESFGENFKYPLLTETTTTTITPFDSCNISPAQSCQVSREINPDEYFFDCSTEISCSINEHKKKSWSKKLKLIKQSSMGFLKLKASRAYLKSLFRKSGFSSDQKSCKEASETAENGNKNVIFSKPRECFNKYVKLGGKINPVGQILQKQSKDQQIRGNEKEKMIEDNNGGVSHRRSFSGSTKRQSATKSSSSFSSLSSGSSSSSSLSSSSNGFYEVNFLKRSNSLNSEFESSIEGAIAHCKQSHQQKNFRSTKTETDLCSLTA